MKLVWLISLCKGLRTPVFITLSLGTDTFDHISLDFYDTMLWTTSVKWGLSSKRLLLLLQHNVLCKLLQHKDSSSSCFAAHALLAVQLEGLFLKSTNTGGCGLCIVSLRWRFSVVVHLGWSRTQITVLTGKIYLALLVVSYFMRIKNI